MSGATPPVPDFVGSSRATSAAGARSSCVQASGDDVGTGVDDGVADAEDGPPTLGTGVGPAQLASNEAVTSRTGRAPTLPAIHERVDVGRRTMTPPIFMLPVVAETGSASPTASVTLSLARP